MWRDEDDFDEFDEIEDIDVEMDNDEIDEVDEGDEVDEENDSDETENNEEDYLSRLRERAHVNYVSSNESIVELSDSELMNEDLNSESTSNSGSSSSTNQTNNTFSATDIVGAPRSAIVSQLNQPQSSTSMSSPNNQQQQSSRDDAIQETVIIDQNQIESTNEKQESKNVLNESINNSGEPCSICCEPFTSTSDHRIVSLKCGHIFGQKCIEQWLRIKESKRRCPECNQVSNKNDVRVIYAKSLTCIDTSELDDTKKKLDEERRLRMRFEQQVEELRYDLGIKESENFQLKRQITEKEELIKRFKSSNINKVESNLNQVKMNSLNKQPFTLIQQIDLKIDGCRLIVINELLGYIVISQQTSPTSLVKGFGIRRIPINNLNSSDFIFLHNQQIKDMVLHPVDALLLTASFDKSVKLVNLITKQVMSTIHLEVKPWCVTWNKNEFSLFYVGLNNGHILECSTSTTTPLRTINTCLSLPIKFICYLNHNSATNRDNFLITSIKTSLFCEIKTNDNQSSIINATEEDSIVSMKPLPISGPIISTSLISENGSGNVLLTVRPTDKYPNNVQHYVSLF